MKCDVWLQKIGRRIRNYHARSQKHFPGVSGWETQGEKLGEQNNNSSNKEEEPAVVNTSSEDANCSVVGGGVALLAFAMQVLPHSDGLALVL